MNNGDRGRRARVDQMLRDMFRALHVRPNPPRLLSTLEPDGDENDLAAESPPPRKPRRASRR